MRVTLSTWDSHSLQDTDFLAKVIMGTSNGMASARPGFIDMGQGDPILGGKTLTGTLYTFHVICLGKTDSAIETQRNTLCQWFKPNDFTLRKLIGLDVDNGNKDWYLEGFPITAPLMLKGAKNNVFSVTLALSTPYWVENDLNTDTWTITADTETQVLANVGNVEALPKFVITPIGAKGSNNLSYKTFYAVHTSGYGCTNLPFDLTAAGLDTATLIGASKMQADGDDLGVCIDGTYVDRWFGGGGINSATTGVWFNLSLPPQPVMTLKVALPNNGTVPATLSATYTGKRIQLSQNSSLQIGNEIITYSTYTVDTPTSTITFTPTARAAKNSSYAAHNIGDSVYWIPLDIWLTYGNSSMAARPVDNDKKPILNLATATNTSWVYLQFGESDKPRTGSPVANIMSIAGCSTYTGSHGVDATPYTEAGLKLFSFTKFYNQIISADSAKGAWMFSHPGKFSNVVFNGGKYRSGAGWGTCVVTYGGSTHTVIATIATPTAAAAWEAIAVNEAVASLPTTIWFYFYGGLGTTIPAPYAYAELTDATMTISDPPTVTALGVESANYMLGGSLVNDTVTGDPSILFNNIVAKIANAITIDCDAQEIYSADGKRIRAMIDFGGVVRDEWLTLQSGNNSFVFTDVGTTELTIATTWRARNTI